MNSPEEHGEKDMEGQGSSDIDEEDVAKEVQVGRNKDDEDGSCAMGESGCFLAVLPSHTGGHLGVARYDEEDLVFELLQLPHDLDCHGLKLIFEQFEAQVIITSSVISDKTFAALLESAKKRGTQVIYLPAKDFSYKNGFSRLLTIAREVLNKSSEDADLELCLHSLIDTDGKEAVGAAGGLMMYLENHRAGEELLERWKPKIAILKQLHMSHHMQVDASTLYSLQVLSQDDNPAILSGGSKEGLSLLSILDNTQSPLGRKLLRTWILRPLIKENDIAVRTEGVRFFVSPGSINLVATLQKQLKQVKDVPRMMLRLRQASASVLDWQNLSTSFLALHQIRVVVESSMHEDALPRVLMQVLASFSDDLRKLHGLLVDVIDFQESKRQRRLVVLDGIDLDLDKEKRAYEGLGDFLEDVARQELDDLGEDHDDVRLSVAFFPQIGYLVAIPNDKGSKIQDYSQDDSNSPLGVPAHFSTDDFVYFKTRRMHQLDDELGDISSKISDREFSITDEVRLKILTFHVEILAACSHAAILDCILGFAFAAAQRDWVEAVLVNEPVIYIEGGRHPLCELCVDTFVPNDTIMDYAQNRPVVQVLTGPNYSGKSIYLKQVALIVYLAHLGSWVPAASCQIGLTDQIFSRIQSRESCVVAHSSFGIDLNQISVMLRNCTSRSLLIIDEFGKGTQSTDGVALLAATISHLDARRSECPRTVVATHFHELTLKNDVLPADNRVAFFTMQVMAENAAKPERQTEGAYLYHISQDPSDDLIFLYRLVEGKCLQSHGYHCAVKAGLPLELVQRAQQVSLHQSNNVPIMRIECEKDVDFRRRAEEMVCALSRFDLDNGNIQDFFKQIQQIATSYPTKLVPN